MRGGGVAGSANEKSCAHGAQINFEDLTPYLTYAMTDPVLPNLEEMGQLSQGPSSHE